MDDNKVDIIPEFTIFISFLPPPPPAKTKKRRKKEHKGQKPIFIQTVTSSLF